MRWIGSAALFMFVAASASAETVRVAAWYLGGFHAIPDSNLENIVEGLKKLDADVVVLPELNPLSRAQEIAQQLSATPGQRYESHVQDQPRANQEIGYVFKCAVEVTGFGLVEGGDLDRHRATGTRPRSARGSGSS